MRVSSRSQRRLLVFHEGKAGKDRQVPASEAVARKLSELANVDGLGANDHLWYTRLGGGAKIVRERPIGAGSFDRWWRRCLADHGVRYRNPHLTRHTSRPGSFAGADGWRRCS